MLDTQLDCERCKSDAVKRRCSLRGFSVSSTAMLRGTTRVCSIRPPARRLAMTEPSDFFNKIAEKYAATPVKDEAGYADTLTRIRKYLTPKSQVLEVGCGTGSSALKLAGDARRIVATDIAPKMVAIAEGKRVTAGAGNVEFSVSGTHNTPGSVASYDAVLALNLFQLVPDVPAVIADLGKKLKPGGVFISKSTGLGGNWMLGLAIPVMQFFKQAPAVNYFTNDELEKRFVDAGYDILESHDYNETPKRRFIVAKKAS